MIIVENLKSNAFNITKAKVLTVNTFDNYKPQKDL